MIEKRLRSVAGDLIPRRGACPVAAGPGDGAEVLAEGDMPVKMENVHPVHVTEFPGIRSRDVVVRIRSRVGCLQHPVGDGRLINIFQTFLGSGVFFADADKHVQRIMIAAYKLNIAVFVGSSMGIGQRLLAGTGEQGGNGAFAVSSFGSGHLHEFKRAEIIAPGRVSFIQRRNDVAVENFAVSEKG